MICSHGWRALAAAPVLSAVVVASLAIGIGVNTAVFSWMQVFALTPLPGVPRASEFHLIEPRTEAGAYPGRLVARIPGPAGRPGRRGRI